MLPFKILSILLWCWFLLSSILFTPIILVLVGLSFLFDRNLRLVHLFSCFWGAQYIWVNPLWKLHVTGRKNLRYDSPSILVSNHQSLVDIILIYSTFRHFRWTSKKENFRLPFVGWVLGLNRSIPIRRGKQSAVNSFIKDVERNIRKGNSVLIFPEGTRSKNGLLGRFREGAFQVAHKCQCPIVPLVLDGTHQAIPKSGWYIRGRQKLTLHVLEPVPYEKFQHLTAKETRTMIREIIDNELNAMRSDEG